MCAAALAARAAWRRIADAELSSSRKNGARGRGRCRPFALIRRTQQNGSAGEAELAEEAVAPRCWPCLHFPMIPTDQPSGHFAQSPATL